MRNWNQLSVVWKDLRPPSRGMESVSSLSLPCNTGHFVTGFIPAVYRCIFSFMSQFSEFLGSSCVLKVQVNSQGRSLFMEHVDQNLTGGRDQLRFYIIHSNNTNVYVCPDKRKRK